MAGIIKRNPKAFAMAVVMHLVLLLFLLFGVDWLKDPESGRPKVDVVKAKVIDESQVMAEAEKLKKEKQQEKARRLAQKNKEQQELARIKKEKAAEKKRLAKLKKKRELEAKKQALARKKAKEEAERKKREAAKAEKRRKEEIAKKKREAAEAERRRKEAAEEAARKAREDSLRESMKNEEIRQFSIAVGDKVKRNWLRPPDSGAGLRCKLRVRLSSNGTVLGVQVVQSSGNTAFDRSAQAAVFKSDPLPRPPSGMNEITFIFDPEKFR